MLRGALFHLSQQRQLRDFATHNGLARSMAQRFVAGETLSEVIEVARAIRSQGMTTTLDHLGENVTSLREAEAARDEYCRSLTALTEAGVDLNVSLKLTALGLDQGTDIAAGNLTTVLQEAQRLGAFIRIDMEGSPYVQRTLDVFYRCYERFNNVGVVIQSYLYRSAEDLERLINAGARVRLVKGAYLEPVTVAYQRKEDVDSNYVHLTRLLLERGNYPAIATHDPAMIEAARRYAEERGIGQDQFEFQMLYGIRRDLQQDLVRAGYNVRVYVPYGTQWYPYLMRRMAERPANVMFVLGNIAREARTARH